MGVVAETLFAAPFAGRDAFLSILPLAIAFDRWGTKARDEQSERLTLQSAALWQILGRFGVPTAVVGWPQTAPAVEDVAALLSDRFFAGHDTAADRTSEDLGDRARLFRPRVGEIDPDLLSRFGSDPSDVVVQSLTHDLWRKSMTGFLLDQRSADATFLLLPGLEDVSKAHFGGLAAVHFEGSKDPAAETAAARMGAYYELLDAVLAELWDKVPEPRLLAVASAFGTREPRPWQQIRRTLTRKPKLRGLVDGAPPGVLILLGNGIRAGAALDRAALVDIAPTLLYGMGFPIASDLDGAVLTNAFDTGFLARQPLRFIPSYETLKSP